MPCIGGDSAPLPRPKPQVLRATTRPQCSAEQLCRESSVGALDSLRGCGRTLIDYRLGGKPRYFVGEPRDWNMRLPDEVLKCVVFIGKKERGSIKWGGTGFLISLPAKQLPGRTHIFLVTGKHVADQLLGEDVYIRFNTKDGGYDVLTIGAATQWWLHPSDLSVDVAVIPWTPPAEADFLCLPKLMFLDDIRIGEKGIGVGDEVHITGLFHFVKGTQRNHPIVRTGTLAMLPNERIPIANWPTQSMEAYLIEARSISGLSGSPVFVQRSVRVQAVEDSGRVPLAAGAIFLLGLIFGHWDVKKRRKPKQASVVVPSAWGQDRGEINVGVAIVAPAAKILETVQRKELLEYMDQMEARYLGTQQVIQDHGYIGTVTQAVSAGSGTVSLTATVPISYLSPPGKKKGEA